MGSELFDTFHGGSKSSVQGDLAIASADFFRLSPIIHILFQYCTLQHDHSINYYRFFFTDTHSSRDSTGNEKHACFYAKVCLEQMNRMWLAGN